MIQFLLFREIIPDWMIRNEIRKKLSQKLRKEYSFKPEQRRERLLSLIEQMKQGPLTLNTSNAQEEHTQPPITFFQCILGRNLKFSSGLWAQPYTNLDEAEEGMTALTAERAQIRDGQKILELGCGWGSLTLYLAKKFPNSEITAVAYSEIHRAYVEFKAQKLGFKNVKIIASDINHLQLENKFDLAVSVEMFERIHNYRALSEKIAGFLNPGGKFFIHSAAHKELLYKDEEADSKDWIDRCLLPGNFMPCANLWDYFQDHFQVAERWEVPGTHYQRSCRAWLELMDLARINVKIIFRETYGIKNVRKWWAYWRVFFMSREELFGYNGGKEWFISHTLLEKK